MTIPHGVGGCLCRIEPGIPCVATTVTYTDNPHCPYHGLLPRGRTDTGMYRVVGAWNADGQPVDLDSLLRKGLEQARRGETVDRGDYSRYLDGTELGGDDPATCDACAQYGLCIDHDGGDPVVRPAAKEPLTADEAQALTAALGSPDRPTRKLPARCDADTDTDGCNYREPHKHGFACDKTCDTCHGHYDDIDANLKKFEEDVLAGRVGGPVLPSLAEQDDPEGCGNYPGLTESLAQLRRGEVKPARTFKEESRWTRLKIWLRWAKEAFFDALD
ncbi:hypothetical protein [Streptomyces hydrogenans]|uniref:Uncharacterized protein n=1 Tax=Streptomyces hydrogenans TaxID=1873719 RepID=A0ABQ3PJL9_9ACTN|nr:hypothetical protein [Streptomyces hydrogenans]GHG10049.1 hypothetical protein GCM10018784_23400 [Streptomyces hydrogenans]GHI25208.1 hypothetical protein Shyd_65790 [Streptomyces hydrogenans]